MKPRVTADIEAVCRKCEVTWHVIVAMSGRTIIKVECKQCGGRHRYRAVGSAAGGAMAGSAARARTTTVRGARSKPSEPLVEADPSRPVRPYSVKERFDVADSIEHPRFGLGVVEAIAGPGKIRVRFDDEPRVLVHARG